MERLGFKGLFSSLQGFGPFIQRLGVLYGGLRV